MLVRPDVWLRANLANKLFLSQCNAVKCSVWIFFGGGGLLTLASWQPVNLASMLAGAEAVRAQAKRYINLQM